MQGYILERREMVTAIVAFEENMGNGCSFLCPFVLAAVSMQVLRGLLSNVLHIFPS